MVRKIDLTTRLERVAEKARRMVAHEHRWSINGDFTGIVISKGELYRWQPIDNGLFIGDWAAP